MEAAYINLPYDEDEEALGNASDAATTPPLSPDSLCSPCLLPGVSLRVPSLSILSPSPTVSRTVSPYEIFSPLPRVEEDLIGDPVAEGGPAPSAPLVTTQSLPEEILYEQVEAIPVSSPNHPPSRSPSPPVAGPSRTRLKRMRWSEDKSGDESDEFLPQVRKKFRSNGRPKAGPLKRASAKFEGTVCELCGMPLGRVTDLPRHKASCKSNPERATRKTPCEFCGKLLPGNSTLFSSRFSYSHTISSPHGRHQTPPGVQVLYFQTKEG